jgi:hypothetical protein
MKLDVLAMTIVLAATGAVASPALAHCPSIFARPGEALARCEATVPSEIVERARRYLASKSSESLQTERFSLMPEKSWVERRVDCEGEAIAYSVTFEYAPFRRLGADRPWYELYVPADPTCEVIGDVQIRSENGEVVDPTISRQEAIAIARRDGGAAGVGVAEARIVRGSENGTVWRWRIDFGDCAVETVEIDAVSGVVVLALPVADHFMPKSIRDYPFAASGERATRIRAKYHDVTIGMIVSGVKMLLGEPDEVGPLYGADGKSGKVIGHAYGYVLRRRKEDGSAVEKDEELVRVSFDLSGRVSRVDYLGERPAYDRS